jgi:hypothetical protein
MCHIRILILWNAYGSFALLYWVLNYWRDSIKFKACGIAHNSLIESHVVTSNNETSIKISCLILHAIFMLPSENLAKWVSATMTTFHTITNCPYNRLSFCLNITVKDSLILDCITLLLLLHQLTFISVAILKKYDFLTCFAYIYGTSHILRKEHPAVSRSHALVAAL